ncbi:MAG: LysR family transcriptional regulator, partial [Pigmentiphaga sp.]
MDVITNFRTLIEVAKLQSFSAAARALDIAPSVVTRRINQLESSTQTKLFDRTTRKVSLTGHGQRLLPVAERIVFDVDEAMRSAAVHAQNLEGHLRIKVPTSLSARFLGDLLAAFQSTHTKLGMDVVVMDRTVDPIQEGFDIAIGMLPAAYDGVVETPLCPLERVVVASPAYLETHGMPDHPTDLKKHRILNYHPVGNMWTFEGDRGPIVVELNPFLSTNDGILLLNSARNGNGVALLSGYIVHAALNSGELIRVLPHFPIPQFWIRAMVPRSRMHRRPVQALLRYLEAEFSPTPPWERDVFIAPA